jgi:prevent-host-death family protein
MAEQTINIADAKKRFSELLGKVAYGKERIVITKRGRPMARLIPTEESFAHLADAEGWLDENDPFFDAIESIIDNREHHTPRILQENLE